LLVCLEGRAVAEALRGRSQREAQPDDLLVKDVGWLCWSASGWEDAAEGSVHDARRVTRGQAAAAFARDTTGYLPEVRVWKRYARLWTRQDAWDYAGRDRAVDDYSYDHDCEYDEADAKVPETVPADWDPPEGTPCWEFVTRDAAGAIPVWICACKGDQPPDDPHRPREANEARS
jgi:hypothetical protein